MLEFAAFCGTSNRGRQPTHMDGAHSSELIYCWVLGTLASTHSRAEHSEAALGWPSSTLVQSTWRMGTHTHTHTHFRKQENTSSPQCSMLDSIYSNCIAGVPGKRARRERDLSICVREYLCDHNNFDPISSAAAAAADRSVRASERQLPVSSLTSDGADAAWDRCGTDG